MTQISRVLPSAARRQGVLASFVTLVLGVVAAGCGYTAPTMPTIAGGYVAATYTATALTSTDGTVTTDRLANGSSLSIALAPDQTTSGTLVDADATFDMTGIWSFDGTTVRITQDADTFVRVMRFVVTGNTLVGDGTFGGERFHAVLTPRPADRSR
jgi:hypothetical protein